MTIKGYFGLGARTFGNPLGATAGNGRSSFGPGGGAGGQPGGGGSGGNNPAFLNNFFRKGAGAYIATVESDGVHVTQATVRAAGSANGLATATNRAISQLSGSGLGALGIFFANGCYVVGDASHQVATSADFVTWHLTNWATGDFALTALAAYDDAHNSLIVGSTTVGTSASTLFIGTPAANVVWNGIGLPPIFTNFISAIACRPGTGVALAIDLDGKVGQSTDGGLTWALVHDFGVSSAYSLAYGSTGWIAVQAAGGGGTTAEVFRSTDDGATWSVPVAVNIAFSSENAFGTDGAGNCFMISGAAGADNYAISSNDGVSWSIPNNTNNGGWLCKNAYFDSATSLQLNLFDPTQTTSFMVSSADGGSNLTFGTAVVT